MKKIYPRLKRGFFARPTLTVARELLGKHLVVERSTSSVGRRCLVGRIVETEAYIGPKDKACHGSWRRRESCAVLWGPPGLAYVYLTYGLHWLLNVVTEKDNYPSAVLIRALEPVEGVEVMQQLRRDNRQERKKKKSGLKFSIFNPLRPRSEASSQFSIANGPANLTQALGLDGSFNGEDLESSQRIWIEGRNEKISKSPSARVHSSERDFRASSESSLRATQGEGKIQISKRIGVDYAKEYKDKPWRFFISDNPFVSRK